MANKWVKDSGVCAEGGFSRKCAEICRDISGGIYIALYTDRFESGKYSDETVITAGELLEIRVFEDDRELLFSRSCLSEDFSWRYILHNSEIEKESYYIRYHLIDKNEPESNEILNNGNLSILSTVGGRYSLPVTSRMSRVKIMTYVDYDENGMAYAVDNRICGFEE